jgi:ferritin-like metal-binding protein YciE
MAPEHRDIDEQLDKYLADAHSIEEQALAQMRSAPDIAGDPQLAEAFRAHLAETERHEQLVRERLEARGAKPSKVKDLVMAVGGKGFVLFARSQPDTPGKLTFHAYSYEALEQGSYEMLERVARRAGDEETERVAHEILGEEYAMGARLAERFDQAVAASLDGDDAAAAAREQLPSYLADVHALEQQAIGLLANGAKIAGSPQLAEIYETHLAQTRDQLRIVEQRLKAIGAKPSVLKDAGLRLGALNWGGFFAAHPDTPGKLAVFAYAFEALEVAGYELLRRVAALAGDDVTAELALRVCGEEQAQADRIKGAFDHALDASLAAVGVAA